MTREEAIQQLQNCKDLIKQDGQDYLDERDVPILDMAIEALKADVARWSSWNKTFEQSGIADLISRADAIKAVEQEYKIDRGYMVDDYTYGFNQAIQYVSDIILHDLQPAEAEWIPCSERLPDVGVTVIYSLDGQITDVGFVTDRDYTGFAVDPHWEDLSSSVTVYPDAWMPLPEPYKDGESK